MAKKYPYELAPEFCKIDRYFGMINSPCKACGKPMAKGCDIVMQVTQVSWFRGDDECEMYHRSCWCNKGVKANG